MLKNKTILITGASSGIGAACAKYFSMAGARLILIARRLDLLQEQRSLLQGIYSNDIECLQLDIRNYADIKKTMTELPTEWQTIDVLVNNAGLAKGLDTIQDGNIEDWDQMIDTNVKGLLYVTREVLPGMIQRNSGHIINIGSISGHQVYTKGVVYCSTKFAVNTITHGLRLDLAGTKVRVSTVDPGIVHTDFSAVRFNGDNKRAEAYYQGFESLSADDVADAVIYCASRPIHVNVSEIIVAPVDQASVSVVTKTNT